MFLRIFMQFYLQNPLLSMIRFTFVYYIIHRINYCIWVRIRVLSGGAITLNDQFAGEPVIEELLLCL